MAHHDNDLTDRYIALWNEPDTGSRQQQVRELWAANGRQVLVPPKEILDIARPLGFPAPTLEVVGHDDLEFRVTQAHQAFVASGEYRFRPRPNSGRLRDVQLVGWEMISTATGEAVGGGTDVLLLDDEDRIVVDYQFIDP